MVIPALFLLDSSATCLWLPWAPSLKSGLFVVAPGILLILPWPSALCITELWNVGAGTPAGTSI